MKKTLLLLFLTFSAINLNCMDLDEENSGYYADEETLEEEKTNQQQHQLRILIAKKVSLQTSQSCPASPQEKPSSFDLKILKEVLSKSLPETPKKELNRKRCFEEFEKEEQKKNQYQSENEDYEDEDYEDEDYEMDEDYISEQEIEEEKYNLKKRRRLLEK